MSAWLCSVGLSACGQSRNEIWDEMFDKGLTQYQKALNAGVELRSKESLFVVTNRPLFEKYRNVFYMPKELDGLITTEAIPFLQDQMAKGNADAQTLALTLLEIIRSNNKCRRSGTRHLTAPVEIDLILYHYD